MQSVPGLWSWSQIDSLLDQDSSHYEYRGPKGGEMVYHLSVLEIGEKNNQKYLHVLVSVADPDRPMDVERGSSKVPRSTSFLWYESGEFDMPTARELYERPY